MTLGMVGTHEETLGLKKVVDEKKKTQQTYKSNKMY